ncbi:polysaccharide deacetylase family protein [Xylocopilactobacillus apis]|uniref:NodB homology domain-containing protein n=1 Tax=Xylocopilactobacillus apis TaxID=2932183 RepID=A0AAU9DMI3_9LACO|nr:polysaccharide deacetylase family protein [Xylocopilactobacillus apis]BDR56854.1 hypothetical protein KIMC2_14160 [Xylocopilactobacillus apis]
MKKRKWQAFWFVIIVGIIALIGGEKVSADDILTLRYPLNLYNNFGNKAKKTGKILPKGSSWKVGIVNVTKDNYVWYCVGTSKGVDIYTAEKLPFIRDTTFKTAVYSLPNKNAVKSTQVLEANTSWKVFNSKYANGVIWYQVGGKQWITLDRAIGEATYTLYLYSPAKLYNGYGDARTDTGQVLKKGSSWKYRIKKRGEDGSWWYQVGKNQWVTENNTYNQLLNTAGLNGGYNIRLLHQVPVYDQPNYDAKNTWITLPKQTAQKVFAQKNYDHLVWYQVGNKQWISPGLEATRGWFKKSRDISFPILMYHDFQGEWNDWQVTPQEFARHLTWLKSWNYYSLTPEEAYYVLTTQREPANNVVWLTMDDGYRSWYTQIASILRTQKINATGFQITSDVGLNDSLTIDQLNEMQAKDNFNVQSHTVTHSSLTAVSPTQLYREVTNSKDFLDSHFGYDIIALAYPYGHQNQSIQKIASDAGYWMGLGMQGGLANINYGLYNLPRIVVAPRQTIETFSNILQTGQK